MPKCSECGRGISNSFTRCLQCLLERIEKPEEIPMKRAEKELNLKFVRETIKECVQCMEDGETSQASFMLGQLIREIYLADPEYED